MTAETLLTVDDVEDVLDRRAVEAVFQPIVSATDGAIVGYESLARITGRVTAPPDRWLAAAHHAGLDDELELLCLQAACAAGLPPGNALLFVNVSAPVLTDHRAVDLFDGAHSRVVLELSEAHVINDYDVARRAVREWAALGSHLAIDDTGSGYASLRHVLQLAPDFIKLDRSLVSDIDTDRNRRALTTALATFARELGAAVVAEGIERPEELQVVRDAGVGLVQGFLLARPGPPWPSAADPSRLLVAGSTRPDAELQHRLDAAPDPRSACGAAVDHLAQRAGIMPSAYLIDDDRLRCLAHRGLWQVLDGLEPGSGITGQCYAEGREIVVDDVRTDISYREAIPGVRSEACVPVRVEGMVVGALNVDSRRALTGDDVDDLRRTATLLGDRLAAVGRAPVQHANDRLGNAMRSVTRGRDAAETLHALLAGALAVSGLSSGLVTSLDGGDVPAASAGPLRDLLVAMLAERAGALFALVDGTTSCYSVGSALGHGFIGMEDLRRQGVRAIAVVPLGSGAARGLLVLAHDEPCAFRREEIEPVELLAGVAAALIGRSAPAGPAPTVDLARPAPVALGAS